MWLAVYLISLYSQMYIFYVKDPEPLWWIKTETLWASNMSQVREKGKRIKEDRKCGGGKVLSFSPLMGREAHCDAAYKKTFTTKELITLVALTRSSVSSYSGCVLTFQLHAWLPLALRPSRCTTTRVWVLFAGLWTVSSWVPCKPSAVG